MLRFLARLRSIRHCEAAKRLKQAPLFRISILKVAINLLLFVCLILLTACEQADNSHNQSIQGPDSPLNRLTDNTLRIDVAAPFLSLNPADNNDSGATMIFPLLYSYLCVPDEKGILQPDLAASWAYDPDTRTWTIYLRPDARFHDHQPVTSTDVRYSLMTFLKKFKPVLDESASEITIISDQVLQVQLIQPAPDFMRQIWDMEIVPAPEHIVSEKQGRPIGSGPFCFHSRIGNEKVVLTANPDYYAGRPALEKIVFVFQPDKEKTWTRLLAGETDIAQELSPKNFEITSQYKDRFYFRQYTLAYYALILYNTRDPLFADPRVRRALTCAIDRDYIVDTILQGRGKVAVGPLGVDSPFHDPDLPPLSYNPAKALGLLAQAGWKQPVNDNCLQKNGVPFDFTLLVFKGYQIEKKVARYIKLCLSEIGVRVHIQALAYVETVARYYQNNDFQAVLTEFPGAYHDPEQMIEGWLPNDQGCTIAGNFQDAQVTHCLTQALAADGPDRRTRYLRRAEARIWRLQPGTFLFHKTALDVMSRRFVLPGPFMLSNNGIHRLWQAKPITRRNDQ